MIISYTNALLLDSVKESVAAYSLRKLKSSATTAIRVRRSSDNAEQDIGFAGNGLDTSALLSFIGANSGYVKAIYDQSGVNHLTQSTSSMQPRIVNAGVLDKDSNGKPVIVFDGIDDNLSISTASISNLISTFTVCKITAGRLVSIGDVTQATNLYLNCAYTGTAYAAGQRLPESSTSTSVATSNQSVISALRSATNYQSIWTNGANQVTNSVSTTNYTAAKISLGFAVGGAYATGNFSETILLTPLTDSQRKKVERNQGKFYNINVA